MSEKYAYTSTNHKTHNHLKNKHAHIPTVVSQKTACRALRGKKKSYQKQKEGQMKLETRI